VKVAESAYQRRADELPDDGSWWGIDGGFPKSVCTRFEVRIGAKRIELPRKLYTDLAQLKRVEIAEEEGQAVLIVRGGDAAGSFEARFRFTQFEVERVVRGGEFPDSVWERTLYHNSLAADVD
jgi:hypothetical protein